LRRGTVLALEIGVQTESVQIRLGFRNPVPKGVLTMNIRTRLAILTALSMLLTVGLVSADWEQAMSDYKAGRFGESAAAFQALVDDSPNYDFGYYMLGQSFVKLKKNSDAESNFQKAIELNGEKFEYHYGLATAYFNRKQYAKTVSALKSAESLASAPNLQLLLYKLRGFSNSGMKHWSEAIDDLEKARAIKSSPAVLDRLGSAYYELGHIDKALPVLQSAVSANPSSPALMLRLTNALIDTAAETRDESGKISTYGKALDAAKRYKALKPDDADSHNLVGRSALGNKQYAVAENAFKEVLSRKKDHCYAMVNLGKVYTAQKSWKEAESILRDAATCAPRLPVIYETLGFALQKQKRLDEAITTYEKAMAIHPSSGTQSLIDTCKKNIAIEQENKGMDAAEREAAEAKRIADEEFAEAERKRKEWEKKREQN